MFRERGSRARFALQTTSTAGVAGTRSKFGHSESERLFMYIKLQQEIAKDRALATFGVSTRYLGRITVIGVYNEKSSFNPGDSRHTCSYRCVGACTRPSA